MPPTVSRQTSNNTPKKTTSGIRGRIQSLRDKKDIGLFLLVYGIAKRGKTRLACTFPKPLLLIGTEDGTQSVLGTEGANFIRVYSANEFTEAASIGMNEYASVAIDTAGGLQDLVVMDTMGWSAMPSGNEIRADRMMEQKDWGTVAVNFKRRLRPLHDAVVNQQLNLVTIAHERDFTDKDKPSTPGVPFIGPALTPNISGFLNAEANYIGQMFIRDEMTEKKLTVDGKIQTKMVKTGKKEYCLRVGPHDVFMTGFRLRPGVELPPDIPDPSYEKIMAVITGEE